MIYLIDDNQNNQRSNNYNLTFVEDGIFDNYLISIQKIEKKNNNSDVSHLMFLKTSDCILMHSTTEDFDNINGFLPSSITNVIKIKELISQEGEIIPLVLFSNSLGDTDYNFENNPNYIRSIKKNLFYERLFDFMEHYKNTGKVELRIIAWGKNFKAKEVSELALEILHVVDLKNGKDYLLVTDLLQVISSFKLFIELALPGITLNELLNQIEDEPMKILNFKRKINQITESFTKYGKNIHPWK
jgi:hypothetical protein